MPISDYITLVITRATQGVSRAGFGTPLILGEVSEFQDRTQSYTSLDSLDDDFATTSAVYLLAADMFSQSPKPTTVKVGRKLTNTNDLQTFTPNVVPTAGNFTITLGAETTATIAYDAANTAIKSALELLTAVTAVTVTGDLTALTGFTVEFTGADVNTEFSSMTANATGLTTCTSIAVDHTQWGSATETYTEAITNIVDFDDDWYCLLATSRTKADLELIAAAMEARRKICVLGSNDADIIASGSSDVASVLQTADYDRTAICYTATAANYLDAGLAGNCLPYDPGSITWMYRNLSGISTDDFTDTERTYAMNKACNIYRTIGGLNVTEPGKMASGEFIDTIRGTDYLHARMEENIFEALSLAGKIPFTANGIAVIEGRIRATLEDCVRKGIITSAYTVTMPEIADISNAEKAARTLPDIKFTAILQGAIHYVTINGLIQV